MKISEVLLFGSGAVLLAGLLLVALGSSFFVWILAKLLYAIGVFLFLLNK